jgi:YVTN family beta-propeller protein
MYRHIRLTIVGAVLSGLMVGSTCAAQDVAYLTTASTLQVIDTVTNQIASTSAAVLTGIAVSPDGTRLYEITDAGVQIVDAITNQVTATIACGGGSNARLRLAPDGKTAYLATRSSDLCVIDTVAQTAASISLPQPIQDLAISPDGKRAYLLPALGGQMTAQIPVMDTGTNSVVATIDVQFPPRFADVFAAVALSPDGRFLYVPEQSSGVLVIDTQANATSGTITDDRWPQDIAVSPDGRFAYISHLQGTISVIDLTAQNVAARITLPHAPGRLALSADGGRLYAVNPGACAVTVVDTASRTVLTTIAVNEDPVAIALGVAPPPASPTPTPLVTATPSPPPSAARACAYVTGSFDEVSVIDTQTQLLVGSFAAPHPGRIALKPDGTRAYVTSDTSLAVIDTSINAVTDQIILGSLPLPIVLSGDGATAYVGLVDSPCYTLFSVDTATGSILQRIGCLDCSLFSNPTYVLGLAITPDGKRAYVNRQINYGSAGIPALGSVVSVIDLATGATITTIVFDGGVGGPAIPPDGRTAYVSLTDSASTPQRTAVGVIDTATNTVINRITLATGAMNAYAGPVTASPDGSAVYVAHSEMNGSVTTNGISVIGTSSNRLHPNQFMGSMQLDEGPAFGLAFTPDGAFAYALGNNVVSIIDTSTLTVVYRVQVPGAQDIAIGTVPYGCVAPLNPIPTASGTPTASATVTPTASLTPTVTPTSAPTATEASTATSTATFTSTPTPSQTPTRTPTATATPIPTATRTSTATSTSTATPVPALTSTATLRTSGGGCSIDRAEWDANPKRWVLWLVPATLLLSRRRFRRAQKPCADPSCRSSHIAVYRAPR